LKFQSFSEKLTIAKHRKIRSILHAINFLFFFRYHYRLLLRAFRVANHRAHIFHRFPIRYHGRISRNQDQISRVIPGGQCLSRRTFGMNQDQISDTTCTRHTHRVYTHTCACATRRAYLLDIHRVALALSISKRPSAPYSRRIKKI